jgi:HK97 family phage major capsid protein
VQAYWAAEAGTVSATKPKFVEREIQLSKLMGLAYGTDELDEDVVFYSALLQDAFVTAIRRESASAIISGTGIGKPLGITVSAGTVTAAKEAGQANGTVVWENIIKMYARSKNKAGSVWLVHPDVHQQLDLMSFAVGTGGVPVPSMKGLPVIETDQCSALGTVGDIILADLNEYLWITKGDIKTDMSIHVKFEYAERAWRFVVRCNGAPMKNSPLTIKNSSNTRSSFVMLATR